MALERRDERKTVEAKRRGRGAPRGHTLGGPVEVSTMASLKRTLTQFSADDMTDWAAALTYYAILAIFPALIALVSIVGLLGSSATQTLLDNVGTLAPGPAREIVTGTIENLAGSSGAAGIAFVIGLVLALNSGSSYIAAFTRASNSIYDVEEGRPVWKLKPQQIGITLVLLLLLVITTAAVAVSGPVAEEVGKIVGAGDSAATVWDIAKIPLILLVVSFMFAFLYWTAPNVKQPGFKFISPGGIVALVIWIVASLLFALYVAKLASFDKTYGPMGGAIVFLVWIWITNLAILFGAELNSELQRSREREGGASAPIDEPFLEPRDISTLEKKEKKAGRE